MRLRKPRKASDLRVGDSVAVDVGQVNGVGPKHEIKTIHADGTLRWFDYFPSGVTLVVHADDPVVDGVVQSDAKWTRGESEGATP